MHRVYSVSRNIIGEEIIISDKNSVHHLRDVLRLNKNERIVVFDEKGNEYNCVVERLSDEVVLAIKERILSCPNEERIKLTLACAIPKSSKMDDIIDKLTQLGVDRIIPLETQRVIIKLDKNKRVSRQQRWQKIALNASQQSQRNTLPIIEPIKTLKEVLAASKEFDLKLIPTLLENRRPLAEILKGSSPKNILVLIGPEGDFTAEELSLARQCGFENVSLGNSVLRVETAAIAVASFIKLYENR